VHYLRPAVGAITQLITPTHTGIDIAAPLGSILVAADDGVVTAVGWVSVGGRRVCVGHASGIETCDYHTSAALVRSATASFAVSPSRSSAHRRDDRTARALGGEGRHADHRPADALAGLAGSRSSRIAGITRVVFRS